MYNTILDKFIIRKQMAYWINQYFFIKTKEKSKQFGSKPGRRAL